MSVDLKLYLLAGDQVQTADVREWASTIKHQRSVKRSEIPGGCVSTCFFGMNFGTVQNPVFFETMVVTDEIKTFKFANKQDAIRMHDKIVAFYM